MGRRDRLRQTSQLINKELARHENWGKWFCELDAFRQAIKKYQNKETWGTPGQLLKAGERVDHHINGYFAPLDLQGKGYNNERIINYEQLIRLDRSLKQNGIRFIYLALPCKKAIYPEWAAPAEVIPEDGIVIPQWRKFIYELAVNNVEVLDAFPHFLDYKRRHPEHCLYGPGHMWTRQGADLAAALLAEVLSEDAPGPEGAISGSDIAVFGNCNLQMGVLGNSDESHFAHSLARCLGQAVHNIGRMLPFSPFYIDNTDNLYRFRKLKGKKIAVYVGFPSASYVRGRRWSSYSPPVFREHDWVELKNKFNLSTGLASYLDCGAEQWLAALPASEPMALYGLGANGEYFLSLHKRQLSAKNFVCIIDGNAAKQGSKALDRYPIVPPNRQLKNHIKILCTTAFNQDTLISIRKDARAFMDMEVIVLEQYAKDREIFYHGRWLDYTVDRSCEQFLIDLIINGLTLDDLPSVADYLDEYNRYGFQTINAGHDLRCYVGELLLGGLTPVSGSAPDGL